MFPFDSDSDVAQHDPALFQDKETKGWSVNYTPKTAGLIKAEAGLNRPKLLYY